MKVPYSNQTEHLREREELIKLLPPLFPTNIAIRDGLIWDWDPNRHSQRGVPTYGLTSGVFSVRLPKSSLAALLKIRTFLWLVIDRVILTWDNLRKRNCQGPSFYSLCMQKKNLSTTYSWSALLPVRFGACWHDIWICVSLASHSRLIFIGLRGENSALIKTKRLFEIYLRHRFFRDLGVGIKIYLTIWSDHPIRLSIHAFLLFLTIWSTCREIQGDADEDYETDLNRRGPRQSIRRDGR